LNIRKEGRKEGKESLHGSKLEYLSINREAVVVFVWGLYCFCVYIGHESGVLWGEGRGRRRGRERGRGRGKRGDGLAFSKW